jgi:hypothetical protein
MDVDKIFWLLNHIVGKARAAMCIAKTDEKELIEKINDIKDVIDLILEELSETNDEEKP